MFLSQAKSFLPSLGIEWDLFLHVNVVEEVPLEPAVVTCSDVKLLFPAVPLLSVRSIRKFDRADQLAQRRSAIPAPLRN